MKNDGGAAFPTEKHKHKWYDGEPIDHDHEHLSGMSLRDYFAAKAMQGMLANSEMQTAMGQLMKQQKDYNPIERTAIAAYRYADAMIAERDKQ